MTENDEVLVEAVIFSAGKPVSVEEISKIAGISPDRTKKAIRKLISSYSRRETAIEISKVGSKYTMQLKPDILSTTEKIAPATIPRQVLKTAALIAYHQPIKQSRLLLMAGNKIYDHVRFLIDMGLVSAKKSGSTYILTTSHKFPEYFGIPTSKREDIRRWIAEKVGIKISPRGKKDDSTYEPTETNNKQQNDGTQKYETNNIVSDDSVNTGNTQQND